MAIGFDDAPCVFVYAAIASCKLDVDEDGSSFLQSLGAPHVDSFNFMLNGGLNKAVETLLPVEFTLPSNERVFLSIQVALLIDLLLNESYLICICTEGERETVEEINILGRPDWDSDSDFPVISRQDVRLHQPIVPKGTIGTKSLRILPTECRQRGATYKGRLVGHIVCSVGDKPYKPLEKEFGEIPIMVKCHELILSAPPTIAKSVTIRSDRLRLLPLKVPEPIRSALQNFASSRFT
ncbi:unnamed protein product [Timema podura]|uniref:DNA-directed RNA polymerase n=1 Tax=Timema podura TaxID=61482 RepID=A0ABN7NMC9_TIMPD|nr:unnamed protein product [Timema podura]